MNVSDKAQDAVVRVRNLLERFTVLVVERGADERIPDPAYDGLRDLVEEECQGICLEVSSESCECRGTLRVTRDWTHFLSGSLYGAAEERLLHGWHWEYGKLYTPCDTFVQLGQDSDLAIMTALEAALTAQLEAANA